MVRREGALPIEAHAQTILAKVDNNRVCLIIGATGCGKSTQMPKLLRDHLKRRVLVVQPRRMAVVAVASRVAEELGVPLGGKVVGYNIGGMQSAELDHTEMLFVTAGIFLEMLKCHGAASLRAYGAVVIDEVHERSCENDLGLACLNQLALHADELHELRVVLMSATADVRRYSEFMRPLCDDEEPAQFAFGETARVHNTTVRYLKEAIDAAALPETSSTGAYETHDRPAVDRVCDLVGVLIPKLAQRTVTVPAPPTPPPPPHARARPGR